MLRILKGKATVLRYDSFRQIKIYCNDLETYRKVLAHLEKLKGQ